MNDQLLVQNSKATQAILVATKAQAAQSLDMATQTRKLTEEMTKLLHEMQRETEASRQIATQSQRLAEEMMKDSVAMKTVSWTTPLLHNRHVSFDSNCYHVGSIIDRFLPSGHIICSK